MAKHELAGKESYVIGSWSHSFHLLSRSTCVPLRARDIVLSLGSEGFVGSLNRDGQRFRASPHLYGDIKIGGGAEQMSVWRKRKGDRR
jgi:hypothetical protein